MRSQFGLQRSSARELGDWWIDRQETAVLSVASAIVPGERLYLLNPAHPDFGRIVVEPPALFHFDPRLFVG